MGYRNAMFDGNGLRITYTHTHIQTWWNCNNKIFIDLRIKTNITWQNCRHCTHQTILANNSHKVGNMRFHYSPHFLIEQFPDHILTVNSTFTIVYLGLSNAKYDLRTSFLHMLSSLTYYGDCWGKDHKKSTL